MDRKQAESFARGWIAEWNARDVDAVLARYADDASFISTRASSFAHQPSIVGKAQLRSYFERALVGVPGLRFEIEQIIWDQDTGVLAIVHVAIVEATHVRECELMHFGPDGKITRDEAFYGGTF